MDRDQPRNLPLPNLWLLSDARNDARLEAALAALPSESGFVFRHYHLEDAARRARFEELRALCRSLGHTVVLSGSAEVAADWRADGSYGSPQSTELQLANPTISPPLQGRGSSVKLLRLATVHDAAEIALANAAQADGMFLSPVFPSRSHPGGATLGNMGFHALAQRATRPVIALGGMTATRAAELGWPRWGAIDGLSL
jgi:thiamine-phosphate pyrophosphorylase